MGKNVTVFQKSVYTGMGAWFCLIAILFICFSLDLNPYEAAVHRPIVSCKTASFWSLFSVLHRDILGCLKLQYTAGVAYIQIIACLCSGSLIILQCKTSQRRKKKECNHLPRREYCLSMSIMIFETTCLHELALVTREYLHYIFTNPGTSQSECKTA